MGAREKKNFKFHKMKSYAQNFTCAYTIPVQKSCTLYTCSWQEYTGQGMIENRIDICYYK